jgi:hypothetical protein
VEGKKADLRDSSWIPEGTLKGVVDPAKAVNRRRLKALRPIARRLEFTAFLDY